MNKRMNRRSFLESAVAIPAAVGAPASGMPPQEKPAPKTSTEPPDARRKRVVEHRFDLVVVGGGLAGLCAAIAAARRGARVAIVQDRPVFGGNSSSEIRVMPLGASANQAWARETGIVDELILEDRATNHNQLFAYGLTNRMYDLALYEAVRGEPNLTMFLNTSVRAVETEPVKAGGSKIACLRAMQLATEKEFLLFAEQYADCTGDATVGFLAGADFRRGREPRKEFDESMAPAVADQFTLGSSLLMQVRNVGQPAPYKPPSWVKVYRTEADLGLGRPVSRVQGAEFGGYWWIEVGYPFDQIADTQELKDELLRHVLGVWNYIKNYGPDKDKAMNYALEWVGMVPGKRESRRLMGDVILTEHDCREDRRWPDRVCYAGWTIDIHTPKGILDPTCADRANIDQNYLNWLRIPPFSLPLRAFYSRNIENLWMAGRNISVSRVALGATRLQRCHGLQGQCVGTAAAYAIAHRITPRQAADPAGKHIARIQQQLLRDDVHVFGLANADPADIARTARATATSEAPLSFGEAVPEKSHAVDRPLGQVFPVTGERIDSISFYVKNSALAAAEVGVELYEMDRIWDRTPGKLVASAKILVPAASAGWVTAMLRARTNPNKPHRAVLLSAAGVSWAEASVMPVGTTAQFLHAAPAGGCDPNHCTSPTFQCEDMDIPEYRHWMQEKTIARAIRVTPTPTPFGASNVNNGVAWPIDMPNLWISDPRHSLPQSVELEFVAPQIINTVLVSFDTSLNIESTTAPAFWKAPTCARHWRLHVRTGGRWEAVFEESDNYQRRRTARFEPVLAAGLKLEILATHEVQEHSARVYEIRAYNRGREG